jgi:predicted N-formylglutamate amidohydrolase
MRERAVSLLFTCEHASNRIPSIYREVADRAGRGLNTHRGYDPGAHELAKRFARKLEAPLFVGKWSRLLIELNRSQHHPKLWSEFSKFLSAEAKQTLVDEYYLPFRDSVTRFIQRESGRGRQVIHIGVHSFTPVLNGETRTADIGLLYDPRRPDELTFCEVWADAIRDAEPGLRVRRNYPYRGTADGFTTHLRKQFDIASYVGIELEVNQRFPAAPATEWRQLQRTLVASAAATVTLF